MGIRFGTEGWRGIIGDDFTFANIRRLGQAIAGYLQAIGPNRQPSSVTVGYDTRFLSDQYARELAILLHANGISVCLSDKPVITPVVSLATARLPVRLGVMITASHNPPKYNGVKLKAPDGGPVDQDVINGIEAWLPARAPSVTGNHRNHRGILSGNLDAIYLVAIRDQLNWPVFAKAGLTVVVDSMHGAGKGYLDRLLEECGIKVIRLRHEARADFGGMNPEPIAANLEPLMEAVRWHRADLGLAIDGDGDRLGVVNHMGEYVNPHQVFLLLLTHMAENRGGREVVVRTFSTSSLIDQAARSYGLDIRETPIGFKHITALCRRESVILGGEESGGYGFPQHLLDRDGVLAGLMLVEYICQRGKPLRSLLGEMVQRFGPSFYQRLDLPLRSSFTLSKLEPPMRLGQRLVSDAQTLDGLKLKLGEDGWILFRVSGTEPLLRIYAEARSKDVLEEILREGNHWIQPEGDGLISLRQNRSSLP